MANFLRKRTMERIQVERSARKQEIKQTNSNECPYCRSQSLEQHGRSKFCRNCHRYI